MRLLINSLPGLKISRFHSIWLIFSNTSFRIFSKTSQEKLILETGLSPMMIVCKSEQGTHRL